MQQEDNGQSQEANAKVTPHTPGLPDGPIDLTPIKARLERAVQEHSPSLDSWAFNGGTLLTLAFTATAALFSSKTFGDSFTYVGAIFSSLAGMLVAAERALAFGARWRFHHEMRGGRGNTLHGGQLFADETGSFMHGATLDE